MDKREAERRLEGRRSTVERWWSNRLGVDGLGGLPAWDYARWENGEWVKRCNPQIIEAVRAWDLRSSLTLFGKTGAGKTSALVARLADAHAGALAAAETPPPGYKLPPAFLYATGYELGEASKRRKLGQDTHALLTCAQDRALLILDELHPSHTPIDVAFAVVDARVRAGLPTAIGAGMSATEFGGMFGAALLRRVIENSKVVDAHGRAAK
jgi:hypothetical protein